MLQAAEFRGLMRGRAEGLREGMTLAHDAWDVAQTCGETGQRLPGQGLCRQCLPQRVCQNCFQSVCEAERLVMLSRWGVNT